ncbi:hypothetical protein SAMD00019534_043590 [Acytostelium subglobosum LB1]|uniref:hypothetical protein n=1 Tax=Acytostelium subglobosum LB1 TaxID=1410327 RepID=UPI000644E2B3|nr:hypothetical protein SAMD00019534_043590 [Acytostelium subglobosum LB1]GAM21184.1 hypothetical protein SAMD00019534_043590 [Acytostelium subglobosum LB1]|eukprot:XP_012756318.1 hypothetical protein SAMD00019534_043590 [Acytostelium subglobosum LB1]
MILRATYYYRHLFDITWWMRFARELNLKYTLKDDDKHNALIYETSRMNGSILFKPYIDQVLEWITQGVPRAKELYQRLWGALSKRNKIKQLIKVDNNNTQRTIEYQLDDDFTTERITPTANGVMIKAANNIDQFDTPFARIMPFIISSGRKMIATIIKDDIDNIKFVHTDGFVTTKEWTEKQGKKSLDYPSLGQECGDLRYEGYCKATVKNMAKPIGEFK